MNHPEVDERTRAGQLQMDRAIVLLLISRKGYAPSRWYTHMWTRSVSIILRDVLRGGLGSQLTAQDALYRLMIACWTPETPKDEAGNFRPRAYLIDHGGPQP